MIHLRDNNIAEKEGGCIKTREEAKDIFCIADKSIKALCEENENLLVFPYSMGDVRDKIADATVLSIINAGSPEYVKLQTGNIMGFVGKGTTKLKISSRFDEGNEDFFLHYMLMKVFNINLFDLNYGSTEDDALDLLMFLFPRFLHEALKQGVYKEYKRFEHNDARVKGTIDIARHIKYNVPDNGKIAYNTRDYSYDNNITQLIRHTVEFVSENSTGVALLKSTHIIIDDVNAIKELTPSYCKAKRQQIVQKNLRSATHPYYTTYLPLQQLCLKILRMEEMRYGESEEEISGVLFDGAWLWEEYVDTIIGDLGFKHPHNKTGEGRISLFKDGSGHRYPDFYLSGKVVLDAKYKKLFTEKDENNRVSKVSRDDIHQVMAYMYQQRASKGGFICPFHRKYLTTSMSSILNGYGGSISVFGLRISKCSSFAEFCKQMRREEDELKRRIMLLME